jgi:A/G-specific adenine glycosylase
MALSSKKIEHFQALIWNFHKNQRRDFPWRNTTIPYRILISEIMLQQTQTDRVIGYYKRFLRKFPTFKALSQASFSEVLIEWQGLGYNRRARFLWELSRQVTQLYKGKLPSSPETLMKLPGIGSYTAQAICVFAYNQPHPLIETNIRALYIDYFFKKKSLIKDSHILPFISATIDQGNPREWFYALMDYGSALKKKDRAVNKRSAHYVRQSPFKGSRRQIRGMVLKRLINAKALSLKNLVDQIQKDAQLVESVITDLVIENMIESFRGKLRLKQ